MPQKRKEKLAVDDLIKTGAEIAGSAAGATIGFFTAGPAGAALGGATGPLLAYTFSHLGAEMRRRQLGPREELRIGATFAFAAERIKQKLANGEQVRQDGFFQKQPDQRAGAEEILEGALLAARQEYEEKKIRFYGNLIANICFHPEIDRATANLLISLGQHLSYRQMALLALFAQKERFGLRDDDYRNESITDPAKIGLLQEIYDLFSKNMLNAQGSKSPTLIGGILAVHPAKMNVQGMGYTLYNLMELHELNTQDLSQISEILR